MNIITDLSSVLWACIQAGKDEEHGEQIEFDGRTIQVNSAEWGYETYILMMRTIFNEYPTAAPYKCLLVKDGIDSRAFRQALNPDYKGKRKERAPEMYAQFNKMVDMVEDTMLDLGAQSVVQHGMEADDVIAFLSQKLEGPSIILSNDGDMNRLITDTVSVRTTKGELNLDRYAPCPFEFTTVYKALVGDDSDNIKGAKGFGPKAFIDLYCTFDDEGLADLERMMQEKTLQDLAGDVADFKPLQKIIDSEDSVYLSYECAKFHTDAVDTLRDPLDWKVGMVNCWRDGISEPILEEFYQEIHLVHAGNYKEMISEARSLITESEFVGFDLETSTPEESDVWVKENTPKSGKAPLDVFGSTITGAGLTFGRNQQYTLYFTVDHVETDEHKNITSEQLRQFMLLVPQTIPIVVHNSNFELSVCYNEWGAKQEDNNYHGFLPNVHDTMHLAAYVDENLSQGLKFCSKNYLGYTQESYDEVTGGEKMNTLTAQHVLSYGADDPICTSALYNHFRTVCQYEGSWGVYLDLEPPVSYLSALSFVRGIEVDLDYLEELRLEDQAEYDKNWEIVKEYLIGINWEGSQYTDFTPDAAGIKAAFLLISGEKLASKKRKLDGLCADVEAQGQKKLADLIRSENYPAVNSYVKEFFSPNPTFNVDSPKQFCNLMFDVLELPVHLRNVATDKMRAEAAAKRIKAKGSPKTDALAVTYALTYDVEDGSRESDLLKAIVKMKTCNTRAKLYYRPYSKLPHWKDGRIHPQLGQNRTNTRRFAPNTPNTAQMPKRGEGIKVRGIVKPHKKKAFILTLDEAAQEMRMIGDYSKDPSLCSCFVGEDKRDVHALTGLSIAQKKGHPDMTYEEFMIGYAKEQANNEKGKFTEFRNLGKKVNFTVEYGARAPKLAQTMLITEAEAQIYIDAKYDQFDVVEEWKAEVIKEARRLGYTTTKLGVRRHLREAYTSEDKWLMMKSDRRAVNVKIQGSSCEQIKQAMRDIWNNNICFIYDAWFYFPVHDELVLSVTGGDLIDVAKATHGYMIQPYADMEIPIVSSYSVGPSFGEQEELGEVFDAKKVASVVIADMEA